MLRKLLPSLGLAALLLAGCDPAPPQPKPTATGPKTDYLVAINKLAPKQRDATFYRAIEDAGLICDAVSSSQPQQAVDGRPAWDVHCSDHGHWTMVLLDDGVIQVLKAAPSSGPGADASGNRM